MVLRGECPMVAHTNVYLFISLHIWSLKNDELLKEDRKSEYIREIEKYQDKPTPHQRNLIKQYGPLS